MAEPKEFITCFVSTDGMEEFNTLSLTNKIWQCVNCPNTVESEKVDFGVYVAYFPKSRYWRPGKKPGFTPGVFCSVECGMRFIMEANSVQ